MAEAVVGSVLGKLANIIENEMKHLGGVGEKVHLVQRELISIECCLRDADSKRKGDERVRNWLNELCDVAYCIEDTIDTFFLEVEEHGPKDPNFLQNPKMVQTLHKLGTELDNILIELEGISKSRLDYEIVPLQDIVGEAVIVPFRRATYQEVEETEVVGMKPDMYNIIKLLRPDQTPRRSVITIVGPSGVGKTTLAHMAYRSARVEFEYHIMLSISQKFNLIDLLRKMLQEFKYYVPVDQDLGDLISKLRSLLSSRRYLIVLDDVWTSDLWNQLKRALPDVYNGSRILMTSRSLEVAKSVDPMMQPYEIPYLDYKESLDLLLKKALPYEEPDKECPGELLELANHLAQQSGGIPLVLILLGGILSTKGQNYLKWERVLRTLDSYSDHYNHLMNVLDMSYHDMPYYLKTCFLYLASFPKNYEIPAKHLIRLWVAEGFISCNETTTKEEMAHNYLDELFQRNMIQVSSRSIYGLIKSFKVPDIIHDIAMNKANQQNFVTDFSQESNVNQPNREIRRASFQYQEHHAQPNDPQFLEYLHPNTRFLLLFGLGGAIQIQIPKFSNFRLLKVVDLVDVRNLHRNLFEEFEKLIHLKYLRFRNCFIFFSAFSIHRLKSLETLDFRGSFIEQPKLSWTSGTLNHVQCSPYQFEGPNSSVDLTNLQTLKWVSVPRSWARKLPLLNNLRKLGVWGIQDWVAMTNLLGTLPSLVSLAIRVQWFKDYVALPTEIVYPKALPSYQNLQSLYLHGKWSATTTLDGSSFPPGLIKLTLSLSEIGQNPLLELGKLTKLKKLSLEKHVLKSSVQTICSEGFPVLQCLKLRDQLFTDLVVEKGVMPMLTYLEIHQDLKLHLPPELQHVNVRKKY